jgi:hypothetical protein
VSEERPRLKMLPFEERGRLRTMAVLRECRLGNMPTWEHAVLGTCRLKNVIACRVDELKAELGSKSGDHYWARD